MTDILHVSWEYPPYRIIGQLAWDIQEMVRGLQKMFNVVVVHPGPLTKRYRDGEIDVYMFHDEGYPKRNFIVYAYELTFNSLIKLPYILPYKDYLIIHSHEWLSEMIGLILARTFKKPLILSVYSLERMRSSMNNMLSLSIESIENYLLDEAAHILCHNPEVFNMLQGKYGGKVTLYRDIDQLRDLYLKFAGNRL